MKKAKVIGMLLPSHIIQIEDSMERKKERKRKMTKYKEGWNRPFYHALKERVEKF